MTVNQTLGSRVPNDAAYDSGAGGYVHLYHGEAKKCLHGVGADVHALSDFFASHTFEEVLHSFLLASGEAKPLRQLVESDGVIASSLKQDDVQSCILAGTVIGRFLDFQRKGAT